MSGFLVFALLYILIVIALFGIWKIEPLIREYYAVEAHGEKIFATLRKRHEHLLTTYHDEDTYTLVMNLRGMRDLQKRVQLEREMPLLDDTCASLREELETDIDNYRKSYNAWQERYHQKEHYLKYLCLSPLINYGETKKEA